MKRGIAALLALCICFSLCGCGKKDTVKQVDALIRAIGEVDAESAMRVEAAEQAYNALGESEKKQVESAFYLPLARKALDRALAEKAEAEERRAAELAAQALTLRMQGDWDVSEDILEMLAEGVDMIVAYIFDEIDLPFSDFVDSMEVHATWRLRPNMTYSVFIEGDALEDTLSGMREGLIRYLEHLNRYALWSEYWKNGYQIDDPYDDDAWRWCLGASFGEIIEAATGMTLEEHLGMTADEILYNLYDMMAYTELASGNYQVEEGKLYLSDTLDDPVKKDSFVSFELSDRELVMTGVNNIESMEDDYPVTLTRRDTGAAA